MNWFEKLFKKKQEKPELLLDTKHQDVMVTTSRTPKKKVDEEVKTEIDKYGAIPGNSYESNWIPPVVDDGFSPTIYFSTSDSSSSSSESSSDFGGFDGGDFSGAGSSSDF